MTLEMGVTPKCKAGALSTMASIILLALISIAGAPTVHAALNSAGGMVNITLLTTSETLLSGSLTSCDPSPDTWSCSGGMASLMVRARQVSAATNGTVLLLPFLDSSSDLPRNHQLQVGINLQMYSRIRNQFTINNTGVDIIGYTTKPGSIAAESSSWTLMMHAELFKPLSTSMAVPYKSIWRFVVQSALVYDLETLSLLEMESVLGGVSTTTPRIAFVQTDQSEGAWTTSTRVNPLQYGTRFNASAFTYSAFEQLADNANTISTQRVMASMIAVLRSRVGLVVHISNDNSIPYISLLQDMLAVEIENEYVAAQDAVFNWEEPKKILNHLPDVLFYTNSFIDPYIAQINATYITDSGENISKTRQVIIAGTWSGSTNALTMQVNVSAVIAAINTVGGAVPVTSVVNSTSSTVMYAYLDDTEKDALWYSDQAELLIYSRAALANDRVVGSLSVAMPAVEQGPNYTCFGGDCAQGSLTLRALRWRTASAVGFVDAYSFSAMDEYPAGNVSSSFVNKVYTYSDLPCRATITGLRLWRIISNSVSKSNFLINSSAYSNTPTMLISGMQVEYAILPTGLGQLVSLSIYNETTSTFNPIERLKYYVVTATNYECSSKLREYFTGTLYRGESVTPVYTQQVVQEVIASYLTSHSPYNPIVPNRYVPVPLSDIASGARSFLVFKTSLSACSPTQWYDAGIDTCFECQSGYERTVFNASLCTEIVVTPSKTPLIVGLSVAGAVALIAIVAGVVLLEYKRRTGSRSNRNAPRGGSDVAVIFTDIKCSTKLWGAAPLSMGVALDDHHRLIRACIGTHRGYEVKTVGDSFMIVVEDAQRAVDLAVDIQRTLYNHAWPCAIDDAYDSDFVGNIVDDVEDLYEPEEGAPWNGLRVRIGIHYGPVEVVLDEVTKGYDYYGPTVNVAARVEGVGDGGQLCVSAAVVAAIQATTDNYQTILLARTALRGVKDEMEIYEIKPAGIVGRTFNNPLIFDEEAKAALILEGHGITDESLSTMNTRDTNASSHKPLNDRTRAIRDAIREALQALRGSERIHVLEKLRAAWRVELPSGRHFTGLSAEQMAAKQQRKKHKPIRKSRGSLSHSNDGKMVSLDIELELARSHAEEAEEEDDEDVIFRVVAQRCAPALKETKAENLTSRTGQAQSSGTRPESVSTTNSDFTPTHRSANRLHVSDPHGASQSSNISWRDKSFGALAGAAVSGSSVNNITQLIDFVGSRGSDCDKNLAGSLTPDLSKS